MLVDYFDHQAVSGSEGWGADGVLKTENRTHAHVIMGTGEYAVTVLASAHSVLTKLTGPIHAVFHG